MAEGLVTPDGQAVDVDAAEQIERDFARAQSTAPTDVPAPPRKPVAADTEPAKPRRGRPPKSEQPRVTTAAPMASTPALDKQRSDGVKGFAQIGAGVCLMLDSRTPETNLAWRADAVTIANAADPLAAALVDVAKQSPGFAAALDKVTAVGPYGALIAVGLSVAGQLARNHGIMAGEMLGAVPPEKLLASLEESPDGPTAQPR